MTSNVDTIADLYAQYQARFAEGDLQGLLDLTADDAIFIPAPGTPLTGDSVAGALQQFLAIGVPITMTVRHAYEIGDHGLAIADWTIEGESPSGESVSMAGTATDVVKKYSDGWKFFIDNPFGVA